MYILTYKKCRKTNKIFYRIPTFYFTIYIAHNDRLIEIAERLELDPRSISKEVRRNRVPIDYIKECISKCPNLNRWPLVCTKCKLRYSKDCCYTKFKYDARTAQRKAEANLINSRKGIDLDSEEFKKLDSIIKCGIKENKSIYQIKTYEPLIP